MTTDPQRTHDTFATLQKVLPKLDIAFPASHPKIIEMLLKNETFGVCKLLTGIACYIREHPEQFKQPGGIAIADQLEEIVNSFALLDAP